jgi:hypothetical protein
MSSFFSSGQIIGTVMVPKTQLVAGFDTLGSGRSSGTFLGGFGRGIGTVSKLFRKHWVSK